MTDMGFIQGYTPNCKTQMAYLDGSLFNFEQFYFS